MTRYYVKYIIRKWWPLLLVASLLFLINLNYVGLLTPTDYMGEADHSVLTVYETFTITPLVIGLGLGFVLPIFIHSYRTRRRSVDAYYQANSDSRVFRRVHIIIALAILIIAFTAGYLAGMAVYALRYAGTPLSHQEARYGSTATYYRYDINFGAFFLFYLIILVIMIGQFFINTFLAGLGNYVIDQIFMMIFGNVCLALCIFAPYTYALSLLQNLPQERSYGLFYSFSSIGPIVLLVAFVEPLMSGNSMSSVGWIHASVSTFLSLCSYAGAGVLAMMMKDPSGEYANSNKPVHPSIRLIGHGAALCLGFILSLSGIFTQGAGYNGSGYNWTLSLLILPYFLFALFAVAYFLLLALWRHSFKLSKIDWICFAAVNATIVMLIVFEASVWMMR